MSRPENDAALNKYRVEALREGWLQAAREVAPRATGLEKLIETRLQKVDWGAVVEEVALLTIVDEAIALAESSGGARVGHTLGKKLRRSVYEYLLSFDAIQNQEEDSYGKPSSTPPAGDLIGAEEVAALRPNTNAPHPHRKKPQPEEAPASETNLPDWDLPSQTLAPRSGFHIGDPSDFVAQAPRSDPNAPISDPDSFGSDLDTSAQTESSSAEIPPLWPPPALPLAPARPQSLADLLNANKDQPENSRQQPARRAEKPAPELRASEVTLAGARVAIESKMKKKRWDEAAALLQQLAQDYGGREIAELALDTGDRSREMGKGNAALNCYLAASRADPIYEYPLARLADICVEDKDFDLAVSYLERIARLTRIRGDTDGAFRIYRKIATIAPYRDDVLELLMRAQTTGRLDA